jgi:FO synthase subunit 2
MDIKKKEILTKAKSGARLAVEDAVELLKVDGSDVQEVIKTAEEIKQQTVGDQVSYVINYNLNLSNICVNDCLFCGFNKAPGSSSAQQLTPAEIGDHFNRIEEEDITEICLVSGLDPDFDLDTYKKIITKIKSRFPAIHVHGITPAELGHALRDRDLDFAEGYQLLKEAGLDSVPGTAAEILVPEVRTKICPNKISTENWIKAIKAAHRVGLQSTATILYGHVEKIEDRVEHLKIIRDIQDQTAGFTEFIPLSFVPYNTPLGATSQVSSETTGREDLLMIAVARLFLDNIANIQASWVKYGPKLAQLMLTAGANDLGGTLFNENISRAAGKETEEYLAPEVIISLISDMGYSPQQRTTLYNLF